MKNAKPGIVLESEFQDWRNVLTVIVGKVGKNENQFW